MLQIFRKLKDSGIFCIPYISPCCVKLLSSPNELGICILHIESFQERQASNRGAIFQIFLQMIRNIQVQLKEKGTWGLLQQVRMPVVQNPRTYIKQLSMVVYTPVTTGLQGIVEARKDDPWGLLITSLVLGSVRESASKE